MTAQHTNETREDVLERILDTVESIDKNVEDLLDRISDHVDDWKHRTWYDSQPLSGYDYD